MTMASTGLGPIKQALVRALRNHSELYSLVGSDGINEGTNPRAASGETPFPQIVYEVVYSRREEDWTNLGIMTEISIDSLDRNPVDANNLDQLVAEALEVPIGTFFESSSGQTSLLCQRVTDHSFVDADDAGDRIYQVGGVYRIWTDQLRTA